MTWAFPCGSKRRDVTPYKEISIGFAYLLKKFKKPLDSELAKADELKIIVNHKSDIEWAQEFLPLVPKDCHLFLQPEWEKSEKMNPLIRSFIENNPQWRLSLQTHKYLNIP